jgi:hypothetical protein
MLPAVVFPNDVMLLLVALLVLVALADDVPVSFVLFVTVVPVSKIRVAIEPLAENVDPCVLVVLVPVAFVLVAFVLVVALPAVVVFPAVVELPPAAEVELSVVCVPALGVLLGPVPYCAIAGVRLNAAAKSPKTSTSATAIDAFFIAKSVQK